MDADEEFARKLQRQFDLEREWERQDVSQTVAMLQQKAGEEETRGGGSTVSSLHSSGRKERKSTGGGGGAAAAGGVSEGDSAGPSQPKSLPGWGGAGDKAAPEPGKPWCQYGASCYRKNPAHLRDFRHPQAGGVGDGGGGGGGVAGIGGRTASDNREGREGNKKRKGEGGEEGAKKKQCKKISFLERLVASSPYRVFLNKCFSVPATHSDPLSLVFLDLLAPALGTLVESAQLNFLVDLNFLMEWYGAAKVTEKPLLLLYGKMEGDCTAFPSVKAIEVKMTIMYGTHHSKVMFLLYETGLRVVIHTANLVENDWFEKTQGYWVSPLFPKLKGGASGSDEGDAPTGFKSDLIQYLQAYRLQNLQHWIDIVKAHDFSECRAVLVGSVPGYHKDNVKNRWGHRKVKAVLDRHLPPPPAPSAPPYLVIQCSSIGSLGKDEKVWLTTQMYKSLSGHSTNTFTRPKIYVMYPSKDDVKESSEGWMGGSCLPYQSHIHDRQKWLREFLCVWRCESRRRTRSIPHIKTYCQISPDHKTADYFLLTSANLSKAAWGELQKCDSQLFIRSYELGVLLLPKFVTGGRVFDLTEDGSSSHLTLPYDLPPTPYPDSAIPWFANTAKKERDVLGKTYP